MTTAQEPPKLALVPPRPKRRGWYSPTRPGPSRAVLAGAVALGIIALLVWLIFGIDALHRIDPHGPTIKRTVHIDDSGQIRLGNGTTHAAKGYQGERGLRYAVAHTTVPMPGSAQNLRILVQLPAGVDPSDAVVRARTPDAVVQLRRTRSDHVPYVDVTRVRSGSVVVDLLVAVPSDGLLVNEPAHAPALTSATRPYDDHVVDEARSGRRLAHLHHRWGWLAGLAVLLGMVVPIGLLVYLRRRWYQPVPQLPAGAAKPAGPPTSAEPIAAAAITRGSRGVKVPNAFAAQVLDLVARDAIKLRHTFDPRTGEGAAFGIGSALGSEEEGTAPDPATLDGAALRLLAAVANVDGDTVQLPDRPERLDEQLTQAVARHGELAVARARWRSVVARHLEAQAVVEHAPTRILTIVATLVAAVFVQAVVTGLIANLPGTSATAWYEAAATVAPMLILAAMVREQRDWVRVRPSRQTERLRWTAWRSVLDEAADGSGAPIDVRVLPYAVASGSSTGIAPRRAGPTDVGLAAATPELITGLRRVAGASR